jgi:hypothetical protein
VISDQVVERAMRDLVDTQQLMDGFPTATLLGHIVTGVEARPAPVQLDWPRYEHPGQQVWLQVTEVCTYAVTPYDVLQHLVAWTDDYRAGRGWR